VGAEKLLGYSEDEIVGQNTPMLFFDSDELHQRLGDCSMDEEKLYQQWVEWMRREISGKDTDWRFIRKDKTQIHVHVIFAPIFNESKSLIGYLTLVEDVTEKKRFEAERSHYQKMGAIGQLAAGIAHEINTPMQFIKDNLEFFQDNFFNLISTLDALGQRSEENLTLTQEDVRALFAQTDFEYIKLEIPKALKQSLDGAQRVNEIVNSLRNMSREDSTQFMAVNCNQIIDDALTISRNIWKKQVEVYRDFKLDLPLIEAAPGELGQVLINLIVNASDAVAELNRGKKGRLVFRTRILDSQTMEISVSDDGTGIPENIQEKVFDPFYTTKPVGKGTGQGLYISRKIIVDKHHGKLFFTTDSMGTTFFIQLPIVQPSKNKNVPSI
jgi:PAS domain S-box-containing protein